MFREMALWNILFHAWILYSKVYFGIWPTSPFKFLGWVFGPAVPKYYLFYFPHFSEKDPQFFGTFMKFAVTFEWMVQSFNFKKVKVSEFNGQSIENFWLCLKSTENPGARF